MARREETRARKGSESPSARGQGGKKASAKKHSTGRRRQRRSANNGVRPATLFERMNFLSGPTEVVRPRVILIGSVLVLTIIGILMIFSSSSIEALENGRNIASYATEQILFAVIAIAGCAFVAFFLPYRSWMGKMLDSFWLVSLILLILTFSIGTASLGAQRWLNLGPISFQPSELVKPVFILYAARIMFEYRTKNLDTTQLGIRMAVMVVAPLLFMYWAQSDLGTTLICVVGLFAVLWLADIPAKPFAITVAIVLLLGIIAVFGVGYRSDRMIFLNPESDPYGAGYQLLRSFYAFGEGGIFGVGLGNSTEKYLYIPEAETDFIFSIVGEELGLIGCLLIVALFIAVLYAGIEITRQASDQFGAMIAGACTTMLVFQAFLNICCVIGLAPTTGKPLPFLSSGGSALIGSYLLVGIILSVSVGSSPIKRRKAPNPGEFEVYRGSTQGSPQAQPAGSASPRFQVVEKRPGRR